jgi:FtsP/CotA-like multicopper oxidase with cupredoxin domain
LLILRCQFALVLICLASIAHASDAIPPAHPVALANDNRRAAGDLNSGVLTLQLEIVEATWYPERDNGPSLPVYAFAEKGKAPQIPGPLLRIPQGTEVRAQIHNALPVAMFIRGLNSHDESRSEPVLIAAGATADFHFTAQTPGTYYYSARSTKMSIQQIGLLSIIEDLPMGQAPFDTESELAGGFIVDPPGAVPDDRVFIITNWIAGVITPPFREEVVINGKSWPYTERLSLRTGDTARWRLLNASINDHAMHLHGFFFEVTSLGNQDRDHPYSVDQIPHVVTQHLDPGETTLIVWIPDRPGRWLLHCHMAAHMAKQDALEQPTDSHPSHAAEHDSSGMGGMVLGITVSGPSRSPASVSGVKARQFQLVVREKLATRFSLSRMGYVIQEAGAKENSDPPPFPGAPLVLTRGERTEITVVNHLTEPTAVHWHGIELESYNDGVPGWSGDSPQITPPVPPGGTFVARMTPPRSGTFIYHTHWHDVAQLSSGLYGPLIVLEPGQKFDPDVDKIFIVSREGPRESVSPLLLNGTAQPSPLVLKLGTKYRLRFINMGVNDSDVSVAVLDENAKPIQWRALAKDGWTLPAAQATTRPARQPITVGETYDFELVPDRAGEFKLQVSMRFLKTIISQSVTVR